MMQQRTGFLGSIPPVVKNILIINVLMFLGTAVINEAFQIDLSRILGLYYIESDSFEPYQYISYMFMHADMGHLFFNMFALWMFGRILENVWGGKRFFIYYVITGIGAAIIQTLVGWYTYSELQETVTAFINTPTAALFGDIINEHLNNPTEYVIKIKSGWLLDPNNTAYRAEAEMIVRQILLLPLKTPTIGASGAVFGVLLAFGMLFPNVELMLLIPPMPIKAKFLVIIYGVIELFAGVANFAGDNVAHFAHLGGMIFGFFLIKYWGNTGTKNLF